MANLHSKLADRGREEIMSEECLILAEMHSKAVDYQKHGEPFDVEKFNQIQKDHPGHVDFMVQNTKSLGRKKIRESPGILGEMFRALKGDIDQKDFLELEYKLKIQRDYDLPEEFLKPEKFAKLNKAHNILQHLPYVYKNIVKPYNQEIHKIMEEKSLFTESDIFNVNCAFSNIVNKTDEKFGHEADIEIILKGIEEVFR